jgi:hypothetical protein
LLKLCDLELGTTFEKELGELIKEEIANRPGKGKDENVFEDEEKFGSIDEDSEPLTEFYTSKNKEKNRRSLKEESKENPIIDLPSIFPFFEKLSVNDKKILVDSIVSVENGIPVYTEESNDILCIKKDCFFKGTKEPASCPEAMTRCPTCGVSFED